VAAIAGLVAGVTFFGHEAAHATTCTFVGELEKLSSHFARCAPDTPVGEKLVSMSGSIANLLIGCAAWFVLRSGRVTSPASRYFLWLLMTLNFMSAAGYWLFSGITNSGDWAEVIHGWQPRWIWRSTMAIAGASSVIVFALIALIALGRIVGDRERVQQRVVRLALLSYVAAAAVSTAAAALNPEGIELRHAAMGALYPTPLLWMALWFRAPMFVKHPGPPLVFARRWRWILVSTAATAVFVFVLGRTISF